MYNNCIVNINIITIAERLPRWKSATVLNNNVLQLIWRWRKTVVVFIWCSEKFEGNKPRFSGYILFSDPRHPLSESEKLIQVKN